MKDRIKAVRKALNMTQEDFGAKLGVVKSGISRIESGYYEATEQTVKSICREFGVSYLWLTTGAGEMFEQLSEEAEFYAMIDRVLAGQNPRVRAIFKGLTDFSEEDWAHLEALLDKLLAAQETKKEG